MLGPAPPGATMVGMSDEQDERPAEPPSPGNGEEMESPRRGRIENLRPIKPGEVRNPKGINGRAQREAFVAWADEADPDGKKGETRVAAVREAIFQKAKKGGDQAQKLFLEQYQGRARQHVQVTGENDGPVRITYDDVRTRLDDVARRVMGVAVKATEPEPDDAGDASTDED